MSDNLITKHGIGRALTQRGLGNAAMALANDPAEDSYGVVNALVNALDTEVQSRFEKNDLLLACDPAGVKTPAELKSMAERAKIGAEAKANLQNRLYEACVQAFGAEEATAMREAHSYLSFSGLESMLTKVNAVTDEKFGITEKKGATRQTAPSGAYAVDANVSEADERPWNRLTDDQRAEAKALPFVGDDKAKQDAFALNLLGEGK